MNDMTRSNGGTGKPFSDCVNQGEYDIDLAEHEQELPHDIEEKKKKGILRSGYTTGTCAAGATKGSSVDYAYWKGGKKYRGLFAQGP